MVVVVAMILVRLGSGRASTIYGIKVRKLVRGRKLIRERFEIWKIE